MNNKKGYMCAKGWRPRKFAIIHIDGNFHYNPSNNTIYNYEIEKDKLYMGLPCVFTDKDFDTTNGLNYYKSTYLYKTYRKCHNNHTNKDYCKINRNPKKKQHLLSLKACIRKVNKCKGIPKGTIITFDNHYYYPNSKNRPIYVYKHNKNSSININSKINIKNYSNMFTNNKWCNELTIKLRELGFIVGIYSDDEDGEYATAFGFNKMIGFSTDSNNYCGYTLGKNNVLYDYRGYFNKWSQCNTISKLTSINEIVNQLTNEKLEDIYKK